MDAPWGYRIDRPVTMVHRWKLVQIGNIMKVQPICEAMMPIHSLYVNWTDKPIRNPCPVCADGEP